MAKKRFEKLRRANNTINVYDNETDEILKINDVVKTLNYYNDKCIMLQKSLNYWLNKYKEGTETFEVIE